MRLSRRRRSADIVLLKSLRAIRRSSIRPRTLLWQGVSDVVHRSADACRVAGSGVFSRAHGHNRSRRRPRRHDVRCLDTRRRGSIIVARCGVRSACEAQQETCPAQQSQHAMPMSCTLSSWIRRPGICRCRLMTAKMSTRPRCSANWPRNGPLWDGRHPRDAPQWKS